MLPEEDQEALVAAPKPAEWRAELRGSHLSVSGTGRASFAPAGHGTPTGHRRPEDPQEPRWGSGDIQVALAPGLRVSQSSSSPCIWGSVQIKSVGRVPAPKQKQSNALVNQLPERSKETLH